MGQKNRLKEIADAIRDAKGTTEKIKASNFATEISNVFQAGEKSEYDRFWDTLQDYGNRNNYQAAFAGGWNKNNFKPKYDIRPNSSSLSDFTFGYLNMKFLKNNTVSMKEIEEEQGITFDFSNVTDFTRAFAGGLFHELNVIDCSNVKNMQHAFSNFYIGTADGVGVRRIEKLIVSETTKFYSSSFNSCSLLEYIGFEGVLAQNGLAVHWSTKLAKESILKLINILSTTTSGLSVALSKTAVNNAFETSTGKADGATSQECLDLIATKSNWTITLA